MQWRSIPDFEIQRPESTFDMVVDTEIEPGLFLRISTIQAICRTISYQRNPRAVQRSALRDIWPVSILVLGFGHNWATNYPQFDTLIRWETIWWKVRCGVVVHVDLVWICSEQAPSSAGSRCF